MKSKDIRERILRLYQKGHDGNEIHQHLRGVVSRGTIFDWIKALNSTVAINLEKHQESFVRKQ